MAANNADESPLGFAGDIDGGTSSFRLSSGQQPPPSLGNAGHGASSALPVQMGRLPPPSPQDRGLVGGGVLLEGVEAGRTVVTWRAQESGLWLEERGLDDDLEGGGLHLQLQGGVSSAGAVGVFGAGDGGGDQSSLAVCAYTDDRVVHRVLLQRPAAPPGDKAQSALSAMSAPQGRKVAKLGCREGGLGPSCWINRDLLVVGGMDGSLHCVTIAEGIDGQTASLCEETLRVKTGWNPLAVGSGDNASAVAVTGFWREEEKQAVVLTLHTDWSFRVWVTSRASTGAKRRGGGLVSRVDARQFLGSPHERQTAAVDGSSCFLSPVAAVANPEEENFVVAAVAAEGGLPVHIVLTISPRGGELVRRCEFEAPSEAGPLVDAHVNHKGIVWTLWDRPRGGGGVSSGCGGVSSYGENGTFDSVHHQTIDEWLGSQQEEDAVLDELFRRKGGWPGLVALRCPPQGGGGRGTRAVALDSVELMESFYLRRMFTAGRFGRRVLASAIREAVPLMHNAGPLSSNSTSLQDLQNLALEGVRNAAEQAFRTLDEENDKDDPLAMSPTAQQALRDVHGFWKRLLLACVEGGRAEARPLGLVPGGMETFVTPFVVRAGRTTCLMPRGDRRGGISMAVAVAVAGTSSPRQGQGSLTTDGGGGGGSSCDRRVARLRGLAAGVPAAFEEALVAESGGRVVVATAAAAGGGGAAAAAAAWFRGFEAESALAREGTAGGLADAENLPRGLEEEGGYKREQASFLRKVSDVLLRSTTGACLAEAAAAVLQTDAVRDVLTWAESLKPAKEPPRSRPLGHGGGVCGCSSGIATAAAFGTVKLMKERSAEARNTAVVLMLVLEQVDRLGLADQLEANIVATALPVALKCMNQYALSAEVGSHHLRVRGGTHPVASWRGGRSGWGGGGGIGDAQPASVAASKPWGCTALEGLFLDSRGVVQDYWAMSTEASTRGRQLGLGGVPSLLAGMCEGTLRSHLTGLDSGGLVSFLHASEQYQLALPLVGLAVEWQWRMKVEPHTAVLTSIARGFLYSAEAAARSEGGGSSSSGPLLDRATKWYLKSSQALRAQLLRPGGGGGHNQAESVVEHFEGALLEVERVREGLRRRTTTGGVRAAAAALVAQGAGERGGGGGGGGGGEDFGGRGPVNALELARAALETERELRGSAGDQQQQHHHQRQARLCQLVFKHASEALCFREAFDAVCDNPIDQQRKENLAALAQHMCESGRLGELCSLSLADCPHGGGWHPSGVVDSALWPLARRSSVDDLVGGPGGKGRSRVNYYDCLYAFYMARGEEVAAARAQDELRERLEAHSAASTLPFAAGAQRARLAALNALSVAGNAYPSSDDTAAATVASICPPAGERRLDGYGRPAGVRTVAVLGREAVSAAGAIGLAVVRAAKEEGVQEFGGRCAGKEEAKEFGGRYAVGVQVSVEVGNAGVSGVVEALALGGRYEEAADVVLEGLAHQPRLMVEEMDKLVSALARACVRTEDIAKGYEVGPLPPLVRGVGPLKPRVPVPSAEAEGDTTATARARAPEHATSLWPVLRQLLRLDSADNNFSYHTAAVAVLLEGMPASTLPRWVEDSYLGLGQELPDPPANANAFPPPQPRALLAPWKAFTSGRGGNGASGPDPTKLLDMYVMDGRLEEACLFLSRVLDTREVGDIGALTELVPEKDGGTDYLPYASIDRLFALSEASLARSKGPPTTQKEGWVTAGGLAGAFETAQERLVGYLKVAKAVSDQAQPNRAAEAAAAGRGICDASAFMMTD